MLLISSPLHPRELAPFASADARRIHPFSTPFNAAWPSELAARYTRSHPATAARSLKSLRRVEIPGKERPVLSSPLGLLIMATLHLVKPVEMRAPWVWASRTHMSRTSEARTLAWRSLFPQFCGPSSWLPLPRRLDPRVNSLLHIGDTDQKHLEGPLHGRVIRIVRKRDGVINERLGPRDQHLDMKRAAQAQC